MTGDERAYLRAERDRLTRARVLSTANVRGYCIGCGSRHGDYQGNCPQCMDRKRRNRRRQAAA